LSADGQLQKMNVTAGGVKLEGISDKNWLAGEKTSDA
jgi:hypothetical protein